MALPERYTLSGRISEEEDNTDIEMRSETEKYTIATVEDRFAPLFLAAPELLAYAEISEALGEYHRDGSGFTIEMTLAVLTKHGYVPENPDFPGMGAGTWGRNFRKRVIAKAKGN